MSFLSLKKIAEKIKLLNEDNSFLKFSNENTEDKRTKVYDKTFEKSSKEIPFFIIRDISDKIYNHILSIYQQLSIDYSDLGEYFRFHKKEKIAFDDLFLKFQDLLNKQKEKQSYILEFLPAIQLLRYVPPTKSIEYKKTLMSEETAKKQAELAIQDLKDFINNILLLLNSSPKIRLIDPSSGKESNSNLDNLQYIFYDSYSFFIQRNVDLGLSKIKSIRPTKLRGVKLLLQFEEWVDSNKRIFDW